MNSLPPRPSFLPPSLQASSASSSSAAAGPSRSAHALPSNPSLGAAPPAAAYAPHGALGTYYGAPPPSGPIYSASGVNIAAFAGQATYAAGGGYGSWAVGGGGGYGQQQQQWTGYMPAVPGGGYSYAPSPVALPTYTPQPLPLVPSASSTHSAPSFPPPNPSSSVPRSKAPKLDLNRITSAPMRNCSLSSCNYLGTVKDVEIHEMDRHLIFPPGWVEKKKNKPDAPLSAIQFNRKLETDEQIAAWIQERKKKWPTADRAAEKEKLREGALARGEISRDSGRGRGRGRGQDRGRGRGRGRGGFAQGDRQDGGYEARRDKGKGRENAKVKKVGDGADDFDSDPLSSSDSDSDTPPRALGTKRPRAASSSSGSSSSGDSNSDAPPVETSTALATNDSKKAPPCIYFSKPRGCSLGDACRFSHDAPPPSDVPQNPDAIAPTRLHKSIGPQAPRPAPGGGRLSLMERLLQGEVRHTTSTLAQVIKFMCDNDMLKDVEVRVGQAEEQEARGVKMVVNEVKSEQGGEGVSLEVRPQEEIESAPLVVEVATEEVEIKQELV